MVLEKESKKEFPQDEVLLYELPAFLLLWPAGSDGPWQCPGGGILAALVYAGICA